MKRLWHLLFNFLRLRLFRSSVRFLCGIVFGMLSSFAKYLMSDQSLFRFILPVSVIDVFQTTVALIYKDGLVLSFLV